MKLRIAKPSDAQQIARVHFLSKKKGDVGVFAQMDVFFLKHYYQVLLDDPYEIVVCAENDEGEILGFNSCTLDAEKQMLRFRRAKIRLSLASIPSIIKKPSIIVSLIQRYLSTSPNNDLEYVHSKGVRGEFWAWNPQQKDSIGSIEMNAAYRGILRSLGVKEVFYEVDSSNKKVLAYHKLNGNTVERTINLPDGRVRYLLKSNLYDKSII